MKPDWSAYPQFEAPHAPDDRIIAVRLLEGAKSDPERDTRIDRTASTLIDAIRSK
jgi:RHH-type proline utilization regulon transcriptional repressor/proline dehydrogenase/delta 1-pyrroline-5-carboxylate dehydrogenase